ncbi:MATE family efflux transporter [Hoyosella altamirensis]|uniref:Putative MATE family efflux protein n=1 Tax=Hoyosella altamirensis TaxID=616997 RepID=A0A839RP48_9ACTN|nr:putative MATE family efflux protein [Hoyosella altamirensis]
MLRLALPALPVLAAEPLYLLYDFAVVGRLGGLALAGLAIGGLVLAQVTTQLTFLTYGTTARASRYHGAGNRAAAVREGIQATWLGIAAGMAVVALVFAVASPVLSVLTGDADIAAAAESWLRIGIFGAPLILIAMAGNGWLRGVHDTMRPLRFVVAGLATSAVLCPVLVHGLAGFPALGLPGSAVANVVGQSVTAVFFIGALAAERRAAPAQTPIRPDVGVIRAQIILGRDLILRSLAFQACFLSAAAVASRFGAGAVGAHQVVLHLWNFVALTLDSLAIAAQAIIGALLGSGVVVAAKAAAWRIMRWSIVFAVGLAGAFAAGSTIVPGIFTADPGVLGHIGEIWWFFVIMIPVAGVVFALDGVLLGSGDAAFLRTSTLLAALAGFLPLIWLSLVFEWGLHGIWSGLAAFVLLRAGAVVWRTRSARWAIAGAERGAR